MVVETATTEVITMVAEAGHETTVGAQLVTVISWVEYTVEVVYDGIMLSMEELVFALATEASPMKRAAYEYFILI
jgi:hypothetical protein